MAFGRIGSSPMSLIRFNPAAGVRIPATAKQSDSRPKHLTPTQLARLRENLKSEHDRLLVDFLVASGERVSEVMGLDWSDVNLVRRRVTVRQRLYRGLDAPKSETSRREIRISPRMAERLRELRESRGEVSDDDPVFTSPEGARLDYANVYKRVLKPAMLAAGIGHGAFHRLRHTCGTELRRRGATLEEIQLHLGHHDLGFTRRVYVHLDADDGPDPELLDDLAGCVARPRSILRVVSG